MQNFMERLVVNISSGASVDDLALAEVLPELHVANSEWAAGAGLLKEQEYRAISDAMQRLNGDKAAVSRELGISSTTLWRRLKEMDWKEPVGARSAGNQG